MFVVVVSVIINYFLHISITLKITAISRKRLFEGGRWKCGSGKCRSGKFRSRQQGWKMQEWKMQE